jgi:hypothetical protein
VAVLKKHTLVRIRILLIFIALALTCEQGSAEILEESGSLKGFLAGECPGCAYDNFVSHMTEGIARPNYNVYNPLDPQTNGFGTYTPIPAGFPGDEVLLRWKTLFEFLIRQQWQSADSMLMTREMRDYQYELAHLQDTELNKEFYILRERLDSSFVDSNNVELSRDDEIGSFHYSWGVYVYSVAAAHPRVTVQVVHPNDDYIAPHIAYDMFVTLDAGQLFFTSAGREVYWSGAGPYTNASSLSDPSRNERHVFQMAHEAVIDYYLDEVANIHPLTIQMHSYDTRNRNYSSAIVTAGFSDRQFNPPLFDWSGVLGGMIDRTPWTVHPAGVIGNIEPVTAIQFYGSSSVPPLIVYDESERPQSIPNPRDLIGYIDNRQFIYRNDEIDECSDNEWLIHIECDELPNCIGDSTEAEFYGGEGFPLSWRNFQTIVGYYRPISERLRAALDTLETYVDTESPRRPENLQVRSIVQNRVNLIWNRSGDPNFYSYKIYLDTIPEINIDSPFIDRNVTEALCEQTTDSIWVRDLLYDQDYYFKISAIDRFNQETELTVTVFAHTENTPRILAPVGGEQWDYQLSNQILWAGDGYEDGVWIELNRNFPTGAWEQLVADGEDDGEETVILGDPLSNSCRIRVRSESGDALARSAANFSIVSQLSYLQVELVEHPGIPLFSWDTGPIECPDSARINLNLHNPGLVPLEILDYSLAAQNAFRLTSQCSNSFTLPAQTTIACTLSVIFDGGFFGNQQDTLFFHTDASNAPDNLLSIPLSGEGIRTLPVPEITLTTEQNGIRVTWHPITETIGGCPVNCSYTVWHLRELGGYPTYLCTTNDTTFVHTNAVLVEPHLFYYIEALITE